MTCFNKWYYNKNRFDGSLVQNFMVSHTFFSVDFCSFCFAVSDNNLVIFRWMLFFFIGFRWNCVRCSNEKLFSSNLKQNLHSVNAIHLLYSEIAYSNFKSNESFGYGCPIDLNFQTSKTNTNEWLQPHSILPRWSKCCWENIPGASLTYAFSALNHANYVHIVCVRARTMIDRIGVYRNQFCMNL